MTDREKVISGLKCHVNLKCHNCPYVDAIHPTYGCHLEELIADALALLKEQEPKAIEYHNNPFTGLPVAHCPNCMRYARQFHSSVEEETHYCPWCGQAVKWND